MYNQFLQNTTHGPILYNICGCSSSSSRPTSRIIRANPPGLLNTKNQPHSYQLTIGSIPLRLKRSFYTRSCFALVFASPWSRSGLSSPGMQRDMCAYVVLFRCMYCALRGCVELEHYDCVQPEKYYGTKENFCHGEPPNAAKKKKQ